MAFLIATFVVKNAMFNLNENNRMVTLEKRNVKSVAIRTNVAFSFYLSGRDVYLCGKTAIMAK